MADDERIQLALGTTAASVVGQRLSLKIGKVNCPGIVIAYFPKTQKHRIRLIGSDGSSREKNFRLQDVDHKLLEDGDGGDTSTTSTATPPPTTSSLDLAIRRDAVGRQLEIYHQVRQKWYKGTILRYVEHCQQHAIVLEPQGKVHLVDLSEQAWRFTDLIAKTAAETASSSSSYAGSSAAGPLQTPDAPPLSPPSQSSSSLATSKYMGVQRFTESTWKAYYYLVTSDDGPNEELYIGCFGTEKDAALAYDVYARKRGTPVNFGDRRICKRGIKLLIVPEPSEPSVVLPESTTSALPTTATSATPNEPAPESTASNVDLIRDDSIQDTISASRTSTTTSDSDPPPLLMEEKVGAIDTATTSAAPAKVEDEEDHPMVDMTKEADIVPAPTSAPHRRISVNDDEEDSDDESVVCTKKPQKNRKRKKASSTSVNTKTTTAKKPAVNAVEEDSSDDEESEFEFIDNGEDDEEDSEVESSDDDEVTCSGDSESSDSDDEDSLPPPPKKKRGRPPKKQLKQFGKKQTKPAVAAAANLFESSSDEEEEEERMIARKLKQKGRSRALRELEDFNVPGRSEKGKKKKKGKKKQKDNNKKSTASKKRKIPNQEASSSSREPLYPVGTRFLKDFPEHGVFEGLVTEWTGKYYEVFYPEDEDRETIAEEDFEDFKIISIPNKQRRTSNSSIDAGKKKKKRRKQAYIE